LAAVDLKGFFAGVDIELADAVVYQQAFGDHQQRRQRHCQACKRQYGPQINH